MRELEEKVFQKGEVIYRENDYETWLYDIVTGAVGLYQGYGTEEEHLIKEVFDGDVLGELEVIEARPRTTTAVAQERTQVRVVTSADFGQMFRDKPAKVMAIMQQMSARIRELQREYNDACRIVAESVAAEEAGQEKSQKLQSERKKLSDYYHATVKFLKGGKTK